MSMVNIGFGSMINQNKIMAALSPESAPIKRMISAAKKEGKLIDATFGRKSKTLIVTDTNQIILCAFSAERIFGQSSDDLIKFMETDDE